MPFTISPEFKAALAGTIRLSKALRIERKDGQVFAFTDAGRDLLLPAHTWGAITMPQTLYLDGEGRFPTNLQQSRDPRKIDNWEFTAFLGNTPGAVSELDVLRRSFLGARYALIFLARENLGWQMLRQRGTLGLGTLDKGQVAWKMNGLSRALDQEVLDVTSPLSRATWGDPELAFFNLDGNTTDGWAARVTGAASNVDATYPRRRFVLEETQGFPNYRFSDGSVTFLSGANAGYVASVLDFRSEDGRFTLDDEAPFPIENGDSVRAQIRAPLTLEDWLLYFGSGMYFSAEPGIPTLESASSIKQD